MWSQQQIQDILQRIQKILDAESEKLDYSMRIPEDGYVQRGDWINVLVSPDQTGIPGNDFADVLMEIAQGIENVLVVPAKPMAA